MNEEIKKDEETTTPISEEAKRAALNINFALGKPTDNIGRFIVPHVQSAIDAAKAPLERENAELRAKVEEANDMLLAVRSDKSALRTEVQDLKEQLRASNKGAERNAWINQELAKKVNALKRENQLLEAWKTQQLEITPDYWKIGKLLGIPLGFSVPDKIEDFICALLQERDELKVVAKELQANESHLKNSMRWEKCKTMSKEWWLEAMHDATLRCGKSLDESIDEVLQRAAKTTTQSEDTGSSSVPPASAPSEPTQ